MGFPRRLTARLVATSLALTGFAVLGPAEAQAPTSSPATTPKTAIAHRSGGKVVHFSRPIDLRGSYIGHRAGEPTMGITSDGDAFVAAAEVIDFSATLPQVDVMRSTDGGRDWEKASPNVAGTNTHPESGDPYVFVDNYDGGSRVFTIDLHLYICSELSFSDDDGETWITNPFACGRPVTDHQTLFSAPPVSSTTIGYPNVLYYCYQDVVSSSCTKSLDGGISFIPAGTLSFPGIKEDGEFCGSLHGHGFGASDGAIYIPKVHCGEPWLAISRDEGATWERHRVAPIDGAGHEASAALDAAGNIYYAFIGSDLLPYLVVSRDGGKKWMKPMMIGSPGVTESSLPSVAVGPGGRVVVGYMGTETMKRDGGANETWNGYLTSTSDALARRPLFLSTQTNLDPDPLLRGQCPQTKCGPVFDFIDVVVEDDETVWGVFVDGCTLLCVKTGAANDDGEGLVVRWSF